MSNDAEYEGNQIDKVDKLIQHRDVALNTLFNIKQDRNQGVYAINAAGEEQKLNQLKTQLNFLLFNYWPKYKNKYTEKFELDSNLEEKIENGSPEPNADDLEFKECRELLYKITELMEQLGHTKYETDKTGRTKV